MITTKIIDEIAGLWEKALQIYISGLKTEEETSQAKRYFSMITSVRETNDTIEILTSNAFASELLTNQYKDKLKNCFILAGGDHTKNLVFKQDENANTTIQLVEKKNFEKGRQEKPSFFISTMPLNEEYTFDEFVRGPSNSWAYAAAKGVVANPGKSGYNPLFIHGGTGLGKTHLMQAIGNELKLKNPSMAVCYLTAEAFLNEYVNALQNGTGNLFREKYRKIDVLLVDDIQFLQKGKQCQEEFFNTFNALTTEHKQIVMTSDVAPKNMEAIEQRLISRFEGGMVQEIESPSYETRLAILQKKAENISPKISEITLKFIAEKIKSHVRAMEGALAKVNVTMMLNPTETLTQEMLSRLLKDFIEKEHTLKKLTIEEIQNAVAKKYGISVDQILSTERTQSLVTPRQLAMYIARKYTTKSLPEIAKPFNKTHATVVHGAKTIEKRLDVEEELRQTLEEIISEFGYKVNDKME